MNAPDMQIDGEARVHHLVVMRHALDPIRLVDLTPEARRAERQLRKAERRGAADHEGVVDDTQRRRLPTLTSPHPTAAPCLHPRPLAETEKGRFSHFANGAQVSENQGEIRWCPE